jgi:solute carrier family 25 protein 42
MASTSAASAAAATESRPPIDRLIAGGAAGALSRFTTAPIDRVKLLIQVNATSYRGGAPPPTLNPSSAWSVASRIAKEEGAVALWRGTGAAVVRILPYSATTFAVFPAYVDALNAAFGVRGDDVSSGRTVAARFLAGALAGTTATVITYPLDLLHARVSAHTPVATGAAPGLHPSFAATHHHHPVAGLGAAAPAKMWDHFRAATRSGGVRSLYAGIGPTLVGIVPYGGVSFATFESLKALYRKRNETTGFFSDEMPTTHKLLAGGASGFLAQTATYPLHVVRRRMQVYGGEAYPGGLLAGLRTIYEQEGIRKGLFKGVGLTWIKGPVAAAVGFTANDALQSLAPEARRVLFVGFTRTTRDGEETGKGDGLSPVTYIERRALSVSTNSSGSNKSSALESLLAGGVAGAVAKTAIAPADRVKIIFQVDSKRAFSVRDAFAVARDIVTREGVHGLWRGNGVMMARVVPYAGVSFASYPRYEAAFRGFFSEARDGASLFRKR